MADKTIPYFHNDMGLHSIEVGTTRFKCMGAKPPFDHPHVYLDMGEDPEIVCPYCSTLFKHNSALGDAQASPPEAAFEAA